MFVNNAGRNPFANSNNQENNNMNNQTNNTNSSATINQENNNMDARIAKAFAGRREWTPNTWEKRIDLTEEQIKQMSPMNIFLDLMDAGVIRITQDTNATRKDGRPVAFSNKVQDDQMGRFTALIDQDFYIGRVHYRDDGFRDLMLFDMKGSHDMQVIEYKDTNSGHIRYDVYYAHKIYNAAGQIIGLNRDAMNKVQDGIKVKVDSFNAWADAHNTAVKKSVSIDPATGNLFILSEEETKALGNVITHDKDGQLLDFNQFVNYNTVRHILYESVINHYALLALALTSEENPAFEMFTFAKTTEQFEQFLNNRESGLVWGYQQELKKLAGIEYVAPVSA